MTASFSACLLWIVAGTLFGFIVAWFLRETKIKEWKNRSEASEAAHKALQSKHEQQIANHNSLNSKYSQLITTSKNQSKTITDLEAQLSQSKRQSSIRATPTETPKVKVIDNSYEVRSLEAKCARLEKDLSYRIAEIEQLNSENDNLATQIEVLETTNENALQQKKNAIAELAKHEAYKSRFEQANLERNTLKYKYEQLLAAKDSFGADTEKLQKEKKVLEKELSKYQAQLEAAYQKVTAFQESLQALEDEQRGFEREHKDIKTKYQSLLRLQERTEEKLKALQGQTLAHSDSDDVKE